ncbi:MAG TPA: cupin domain-containing protein [Thermoanaerobaculaceae bacterium]|nr:cupin domain-containing protein [Thermoanaerobaculaceae bacterium]
MSRVVEKPWGAEEIFAETDCYVGKILTVRAGHELSLQYHRVKDETMRVLEGTCELHVRPVGEEGTLVRLVMGAGDVQHIPPGVVHRLVAVTDVRLVEVSTPELDDVVRLADRYGRVGTNTP